MLDVIRKRAVHAKALPLGLHWVMLVIAGVLFALVATFVDLRPVVDENFFFSTSDPGVQQSKKVEQRFLRSRSSSWRCRPTTSLRNAT